MKNVTNDKKKLNKFIINKKSEKTTDYISTTEKLKAFPATNNACTPEIEKLNMLMLICDKYPILDPTSQPSYSQLLNFEDAFIFGF